MSLFCFIFFLGSFLCVAEAEAQQVDYSIRGRVYDSETFDPMSGANVLVYDTAGVYRGGASCDEAGDFRITKMPEGIYMLNVSFLGYKTERLRLTLSGKKANIRLKDILLKEEIFELGETKITTRGREVIQRADTTVYFASYFKTTPGSNLGDLIRRMPGMTEAEEGQIKTRGKTVKRILVNGKEVFGDDLSLALKYLPSHLIHELKVYDRKTEEAERTGIDDGERETVIDLTVNEDVQNNWLGDVLAAYGTSECYTGQFSLNRFQDKRHISVTARAANGGVMGKEKNQDGAIGFRNAWEKFEISGSMSLLYSGMQNNMRSSVQSFENPLAAFTESAHATDMSNRMLSSNLQMEWRPDSLTTIHVQPNFNISGNMGGTRALVAAFLSDPNSYLIQGGDPLDQLSLLPDSVLLHANRTFNDNEQDSWRGGMHVSLSRRLRKPGRVLMVGLHTDYSNGKHDREEFRQIDYFQLKTVQGGDSVFHRAQYDDSRQRSASWGGRFTYTEPLSAFASLYISYKMNGRREREGRDVSAVADPFVAYWGLNGTNYSSGRIHAMTDSMLCRDINRLNLEQDIEGGLNIQRTKYQLNFGVLCHTQWSWFTYHRQEKLFASDYAVTNWSPKITGYYNADSNKRFYCSYMGHAGRLEAEKLIPDTLDLSDPLNLNLGNPDLKPSFAHSIGGGYDVYIPETMRSYNVNFYYQLIQNSVSSRNHYDALTGRRTSRPVNVDGNMNASLNLSACIPLCDNKLTLNVQSNANYTRYVGFANQGSGAGDVRTVTNQWHVSPEMQLGYRNDWLNASLTLGGDWSLSHNSLLEDARLNLYGIDSKLYTVFTMPWGMELTSSLNVSSQWGYSFSEMNRYECLWDMYLSQRILKKRQAMVSLQFFDILNARNASSRSVSSSMRTDIRYDSFGRYVMLQLSYQFTLFGKKKKHI